MLRRQIFSKCLRLALICILLVFIKIVRTLTSNREPSGTVGRQTSVSHLFVTPKKYVYGNEEFYVWPISFSAPEEVWVPVVPYKTEGFATIIPGNTSTYVYDDEKSYYEGYR